MSTASKPNYRTALDTATGLCFHIGRQRRGASEFQRWGDPAKAKQNELFIIKYPMAPRP